MTEAWTGPQVAWTMARGDTRRVRRQADQQRAGLARLLRCSSSLGLADLRRPLSLRNLDLLALLSFSVSLWFFNRGDIFTSVPLAYPPLLYLLGRCVWIGLARPAAATARARSGRSGCSRRRRVFLGRLPRRPERRATRT